MTRAGSDHAVLGIDCVGKTFGIRRVLTSASAWAKAGRIAALLGRNGCGKSTLLRIAAGMLTPDYGSIRFLGVVHARPRLHRLARAGLFYLPERGLLGWSRTVGGHLSLFAHRFGGDPTGVIERFQLEPLLDVLSYDLSTGERRRVEIAIALLRQPICLIADEPLLGIAPKDVDIVAEGIRELANRGCAVLLTGHELAPLLALADDVLWMTAGTTHALGSPADAAAHDQFRREYLGQRVTSPARP